MRTSKTCTKLDIQHEPSRSVNNRSSNKRRFYGKQGDVNSVKLRKFTSCGRRLAKQQSLWCPKDL
eukprot:6397157-Amphidinium_carterae.1